MVDDKDDSWDEIDKLDNYNDLADRIEESLNEFDDILNDDYSHCWESEESYREERAKSHPKARRPLSDTIDMYEEIVTDVSSKVEAFATHASELVDFVNTHEFVHDEADDYVNRLSNWTREIVQDFHMAEKSRNQVYISMELFYNDYEPENTPMGILAHQMIDAVYQNSVQRAGKLEKRHTSAANRFRDSLENIRDMEDKIDSATSGEVYVANAVLFGETN